ncbi:DUF1281 family ferredoxin-like fold protein [Neisseria canis]|uniref:YubB ferredoxin-like domain-containing protein n=1 Tax=Neisseria canis TaxID=493 RepID=A0A1X3CZC6_9NEIS|nr:hypothetical protein [Neisseria canis]OSI12978.1 hypothetical protein BWD07_02590 [Neisseria canis]VEF02438.1 Uncharacterised protein [Neisseria canis]
MPNHVTNIMTVKGPEESVAKLKAVWFRHQAPDGKTNPDLPDMCVDFNGILPMPDSLNIECGSTSSWAEDWLKLKDDWLLSGAEMEKLLITRRLKEHFSEHLNWETDTVGRLKEMVAGEPGLLSKIGLSQQYLEKIQHNLAIYGCPTWYEWCYCNWGTKWNAYHQYLSEWSDTSFCITFDTAWSPPAPVFCALTEAFPDVEMEILYIDEGGGFAGTYTASEGFLEDFPCDDKDFRSFAEEHFGWSFDYDE